MHAKVRIVAMRGEFANSQRKQICRHWRCAAGSIPVSIRMFYRLGIAQNNCIVRAIVQSDVAQTKERFVVRLVKAQEKCEKCI